MLFVTSIVFLLSMYYVFRRESHENANLLRTRRIPDGLILMFGFFLAYGGIWSLHFSNNGHPVNSVLEGVLISIMGLGAITVSLPFLMPWQDVVWDEHTLEGPNKLFGPVLSISRSKIFWKDIAEAGYATNKYEFLKTKDGEVIYFNPNSQGIDAFRVRTWQCFPDEL